MFSIPVRPGPCCHRSANGRGIALTRLLTVSVEKPSEIQQVWIGVPALEQDQALRPQIGQDGVEN
jgi:hypothetical protein